MNVSKIKFFICKRAIHNLFNAIKPHLPAEDAKKADPEDQLDLIQKFICETSEIIDHINNEKTVAFSDIGLVNE